MSAGHAMVDDTTETVIADEDRLRARFYVALSQFLGAAPTTDMIDHLRSLEGDATPLGQALAALGSVAANSTIGAVEEEYAALFVGMGQGGEVTPFGSYYLTGFMYEKPLAEVRRDLEKMGIEATGRSGEPEDHIAVLCETMAGMITGGFGAPASLELQRCFFERHMKPWAGRFFLDLEKSKAAVFYMPVATVGRLFMEIEANAFEMTA